ncbi:MULTISPECIES: hypothetical protein [Fredinandcohnia]|uniref:Photosystem II protein N n=1 Tax=Fredinandcohnia salidurans TaxID=2595041 RepID=A0ABW4MNU6_9BACI|nr:hypothetical protein [Fredinandcohnia onubensis]
MLGLWLTLIGMSVLYFISAGFWFYFVATSMDIDDSKKIDPLPDEKE